MHIDFNYYLLISTFHIRSVLRLINIIKNLFSSIILSRSAIFSFSEELTRLCSSYLLRDVTKILNFVKIELQNQENHGKF